MRFSKILILCSVLVFVACKPYTEEKSIYYYMQHKDELMADLDYCQKHPYASFCSNTIKQYAAIKKQEQNKLAIIKSVEQTSGVAQTKEKHNFYVHTQNNFWLHIDELPSSN